MLEIQTNDFHIDTRFYHFQGKKMNSSLDGNKSFEVLNALLGECQDHVKATPTDVLIRSLGGAWKTVAEKGWEKAMEDLDQYSVETWLRYGAKNKNTKS